MEGGTGTEEEKERLRKMKFLWEILKAVKANQLIAYQRASRLTPDFSPEIM